MTTNEKYVCRNLETKEIVELGDEIETVTSSVKATVTDMFFPSERRPEGVIVVKLSMQDESVIENPPTLHMAYLPIAVNCEFELVN